MTQDFSAPEGIHTIVLGVGDLNGIMRGKRIPASHWNTICKEGNAIIIALMAIDMTCDVWDTPFTSFSTGYPDMHIYPDSKPVPLPWEPGVAICFGRAEGMDHKPIAIDPKQVLIKQVERAKAMGFEVSVGTELEFFLLDPVTGLPRDNDIDVYGLERSAQVEHVLGPIRTQLEACGIPIEQSNPEYASGQFEVNVRYCEALLAADRVVLFRSLLKQLARQHDYMATFMPKPFIDQSGSGFHCHYSLWKDGKNMFSDQGKMNKTGIQFLAGLQKRMRENTIFGSATVNGYRRKVPYTFCPTSTSWGYDNRTVGLRIIEGAENAPRVEKRDAGADANPYLLLATDIAAGLDGIEQGLEPTEPTMGDAYETFHGEPLPTELSEAVQIARASDWAKEVVGEHMFELYLQQSERELEFFKQQVTPVETERYLRNL